MTDTPNSENKDFRPEDEAARKAAENEALFGDLDDEEAETPEEILADRNRLLQQVSDLGIRLGTSETENLALTKQLAAQKQESTAAQGRLQTQFEEQKAFAVEKFVKDVLPVIDNFERGLAAIPAEQRANDAKFDKMAQGIEKILGQLTAVFNKHGIKEINPAEGADFDPNKHEAVTVQEKEGLESDAVVTVAQKGYELNGRVVRPARVIVTPS